MFIERFYNLIDFLRNEGQSRYFTPEEKQLAIQEASMALFREEYKKFEATQKITDSLRAFITAPVSVNISSGKGDLPSDYVHFVNGTAEGWPLDVVTSGRWEQRKNDKLCPPEKEYPIGRIYGKFIEVEPKDKITEAEIIYLKYPVKEVFNYNYSDDGRDVVFDASGSVDTEWPEFMHTQLVAKAISILGIPLKDQVYTTIEQFFEKNEQ